ncbi:hypothetical protein C8R47DRAFT_6829 [Mycena vitilis]|nr:hypothetical protein C8R47DRAFT_6829 [Mycena vitilis]
MPDCPAYWSLDPSGAEQLTTDEARSLGFPDIQFRMEVWGRCWDDSVYAAIRQCHEAEGFDPYSQNAAIAMGCPLIEISCDRDALLAHIKANGAYDESSESDAEEYFDLAEGENERGAHSKLHSCLRNPDEKVQNHQRALLTRTRRCSVVATRFKLAWMMRAS